VRGAQDVLRAAPRAAEGRNRGFLPARRFAAGGRPSPPSTGSAGDRPGHVTASRPYLRFRSPPCRMPHGDFPTTLACLLRIKGLWDPFCWGDPSAAVVALWPCLAQDSTDTILSTGGACQKSLTRPRRRVEQLPDGTEHARVGQCATLLVVVHHYFLEVPDCPISGRSVRSPLQARRLGLTRAAACNPEYDNSCFAGPIVPEL
jgi:hypothetical protein